MKETLKYLWDLLQRCQTTQDSSAVLLFTALCFTDSKLYDHAENIYLRMIHTGLANSNVYSNLGYAQIAMGKFDEAIQNFNHALDYDQTNEYAYNNLAQTYFKVYDLENAKEYALKALEFNPQFSQASSLLAIIYALQNDQMNYEKFFHMAISCGYDPESIKNAIKNYKASRDEDIFDEDNSSEELSDEPEEGE